VQKVADYGWNSVVGTATDPSNVYFHQHMERTAMLAKWENNCKNLSHFLPEVPKHAQTYGLEKQPTVAVGCVQGGRDWEKWHFENPDTMTMVDPGGTKMKGLLDATTDTGMRIRKGYPPDSTELETHTRAFIQDHLQINVKMVLFGSVADLETFFNMGMPLSFLQ